MVTTKSYTCTTNAISVLTALTGQPHFDLMGLRLDHRKTTDRSLRLVYMRDRASIRSFTVYVLSDVRPPDTGSVKCRDIITLQYSSVLAARRPFNLETYTVLIN